MELAHVGNGPVDGTHGLGVHGLFGFGKFGFADLDCLRIQVRPIQHFGVGEQLGVPFLADVVYDHIHFFCRRKRPAKEFFYGSLDFRGQFYFIKGFLFQ